MSKSRKIRVSLPSVLNNRGIITKQYLRNTAKGLLFAFSYGILKIVTFAQCNTKGNFFRFEP